MAGVHRDPLNSSFGYVSYTEFSYDKAIKFGGEY